MAFYFADLGFDVWMGNQRGNRHSKFHTFKDVSDDDFWDFSFYELGKYDQPALIDYILRNTGVPNLTYVGHSQGTTQIFSALSEDSEFFRERVNLFIMLAPVARVDRATNSTMRSVADNKTAIKVLKKMGPCVMPDQQVGGKFMSGLMRLTGAATKGAAMMSDEDPTLCSQEGFKNYLGHFPAGTSFQCMDHYRQLYLARRF
jgi:pimeloyl-ACP methyl ester carboxylesterase